MPSAFLRVEREFRIGIRTCSRLLVLKNQHVAGSELSFPFIAPTKLKVCPVKDRLYLRKDGLGKCLFARCILQSKSNCHLFLILASKTACIHVDFCPGEKNRLRVVLARERGRRPQSGISKLFRGGKVICEGRIRLLFPIAGQELPRNAPRVSFTLLPSRVSIHI